MVTAAFGQICEQSLPGYLIIALKSLQATYIPTSFFHEEKYNIPNHR